MPIINPISQYKYGTSHIPPCRDLPVYSSKVQSSGVSYLHLANLAENQTSSLLVAMVHFINSSVKTSDQLQLC